jgi:predicted metalloprotease with PDZ domain
VSGFEEIDFAALLTKAGLQLSKGYQLGTPYANSKTEKPGMLGIRTRLAGDRVLVANTLAGLPAYEGGLNTGDELVAIDGLRVDAANSLERLSDLRAGQRVTLTFFRRERLTSLELIAAPKPFDRYSIAPMKEASGAQTALRVAWLNEK